MENKYAPFSYCHSLLVLKHTGFTGSFPESLQLAELQTGPHVPLDTLILYSAERS